MGGLGGSIRLCYGRILQKLSAPRLVFRAPSSFWPSFPFIGSFSCHRSPRQGRVFCPTSLSPHLSLRTGHLAGALPSPLPHGPSLCTCVRGRLPPLSRGELSHWAQTEGLLQLCLHKDILTESPVRWREGSVQQVPLVMTIFLSSFWPNLIYLPHFNEAPSYNTATVISHQVGSQTWSHSLLPSAFLSFRTGDSDLPFQRQLRSNGLRTNYF